MIVKNINYRQLITVYVKRIDIPTINYIKKEIKEIIPLNGIKKL